jgi:hypothetical protein
VRCWLGDGRDFGKSFKSLAAILCAAAPAAATDLTGHVQGPDGKPVTVCDI